MHIQYHLFPNKTHTWLMVTYSIHLRFDNTNKQHCGAVQWSWFARVNALCHLSCKKWWEVTASLPGRFLSRRCFTLCITMEVEPRIAKQYKCHHCCSWKITRESGWRVEKSVFVSFFWLTRRLRFRGKKSVLGHPITWATSCRLLPDTCWLWASKNAFKVCSVKFTNSIVKKVCTGSKSSQGT